MALVERLDKCCVSASLSRLDLEQFLGGLDSFDDELLIVDLNSSEIPWCSSAFACRFAFVCKTNDLNDLYSTFPGIAERLANAEEDNDQGKKAIFVASENRFYDLAVSVLTHHLYLLRFRDLSKKASETQRYLEDREQLFSMSRTLSVSEMATTLAHELNQPIGTLMNLLHGIKQRLGTNQKAYDEMIKALDLAQQQTKFASGVISRVRDYTRSRQPDYQRLSVTDLVTSSVSLLDWEIQRDDVGFSVNFSDSMSFDVDGDYVMLQQVLVNLLRNALDAVREARVAGDRAITINITSDEKYIDIAIEDNGLGLSKQGEDSLFVPFSSTKPNGMGIGLNICRSFIELHQGKLWLSSLDSGGCAAHVLLPKKEV